MSYPVTLTAHRGYRQKFPENTMIAFREALKLDIDSIETDVHMTADRQMVIMHDGVLDRTTDKKGRICQLTLDEVKKADAGVRFDEQFRDERVPTLDEFLSLMATRPDVRVLLELKDYPEDYGDFAYVSCEKALERCRKYGIWGRERLTVITFSTALMAWIRHRHAGEDIVLHGFYPKRHMRGSDKDAPYQYMDEVCVFAGRTDAMGLPLPEQSPVEEPEVFADFAAMGLRTCVYMPYNVNEADYKLALERGATGFTCDDPYTCGKILDKLGARKLK